LTGIEQAVGTYPTPAALWQRYRNANGLNDDDRAVRLLTPSNHAVGKGERYYHQIAINRTIEAILNGNRLLISARN
jgi:type I restriction enzyme R subunit